MSLSLPRSVAPGGGRPLGGTEFGKDRLAGNGGLAKRHARYGACRQEDIEPRAEAGEAEALARIQRLVRLREAENAARHEAGDLHDADGAMGGLDDKAIALIVLARLVELGIQEAAATIGYCLDAAAHRSAVHM